MQTIDWNAMADDAPLDTRSGIALIERVVVIEQRQLQLATDAASMRSTLHDINDNLQKLVIQEYQRKGEKGAITMLGSLLVGTATISGAITSFILWLTGLLGHK